MRRPTALVLSPTPPVPADYGNRNRVRQTYDFLAGRGFEVSFLLYPMDGDWEKEIPGYYKCLQSMFFYFDVVGNSRPLHSLAARYHHDIDEWWDENIAVELEWLFRRKRFDIFLVNYPFLSRGFEFCPAGTLKILDSHDAFAGRREMFEKFGVAPEYFYTNEIEEAVAFDRADVVIGIKKTEAQTFRSRTSARVVSIPYWKPVTRSRSKEERSRPKGKALSVGFIGAANSVNAVNMRAFVGLLAEDPRILSGTLRLVVVGNVCDSLSPRGEWLELRGRVPSVEAFYAEVDIVVAPLRFSTGIKIKVGEALAHGKPVVATENAFDGFTPYHPTQHLHDLEEVVDTLFEIADGRIPLAELRTAAKSAAAAAAHNARKGFAELGAIIGERVRRIYVIVDRDIWYRACFVDEFACQAIEFLSHIAGVVIAYTGRGTPDPNRIFADVEFIKIARDNVASEVVALSKTCRAAAVLCAAEERAIADEIEAACHPGSTVFALAPLHEFRTGFRLRQAGEGEGPRLFDLAPLRYVPVAVQGGESVPQAEFVVALQHDASKQDRALAGQIIAHLGRNGRAASLYEMPAYGEYSTDLFQYSGRARSARWVLIGEDTLAWACVRHLLLLSDSHGLCLRRPGAREVAEIAPHIAGTFESYRHSVGGLTEELTELHDLTQGWDRLWGAIA